MSKLYLIFQKHFLESNRIFFFFIAIPALKPVVYDLFLLRAANKSDISRELETQREVVVSMLLRLVQYHQVSYQPLPV